MVKDINGRVIAILEQNDGILNRREWWSLSNSCEALVAYGDKICSIHLTNKEKIDITQEVAKIIKEQANIAITVTATIDSYFIECSKEDLETLMRFLDKSN